MPDSLFRSMEVLAYRGKNRLVNLFDRPVVVLLYHRVTSLCSDPQMLAVSPDNFRRQLQYLKNSFPVVRFEDDWSQVKKPAIVITFDDGYADNAREALPILEEVGVPATFFVSTGPIVSRQEFWWDELEHIVLGDHKFPGQFELADSHFGQNWPTGTGAERRTLFQEIQSRMKKVDAQRRENWLKQMRHWVHMEEEFCEAHHAMTVEELRRLSRSRWVTIGAHTVTHTALSSMTPEDQWQEIIGSKMQLESWLERKVSVFSYPFGTKEDYTPETVCLCKEAGFLKVAYNFSAQVHSWTDLYQIPRQLVRNWTAEVFAERLNGFWVS